MENGELKELIEGLNGNPKRLSSRYFYDKRGSELFDQICELDEYYLTRTEFSILCENIHSIAECFNDDALLVEFGSGSSTKTRLLLEHIKNLGGYIPIDISKSHLDEVVDKLSLEFPELEIHPLAADFTLPLELPKVHHNAEQRVIFFPGSTIGNFTKKESRKFFETIRNEIRLGDGFILGADLVKDEMILEDAYNDSKGVTADFNLNILLNINNRFESNFNLEKFQHKAVFNSELSRIEMYLISNADQTIKIGNSSFNFEKGELLLTEYSHKYTIDSLRELVNGLFSISKTWIDSNKYFALLYLKPI